MVVSSRHRRGIYTESMESWVVGYEGDDDVERHASLGPEAVDADMAEQASALRIRVISDYI